MKCAIYARVSTGLDSQKDSLESQVSYFENFIKEKHWELVGVYADEGITGRSTAKRTELKRLMRDAKLGLFDVVLIKALSRLSRDTVDSLNLVRTLNSLNIKLYSSREGEIKDEFILSTISAVNQRQSEDISYNVSWGISEKARRGIFHGTPPYGYDKVEGKLIPNPVHSQTVKLIFDLYLNRGLGIQAIANYLTEKCIPTPRAVLSARNAGYKWYDSAVKIILTNPHYTGDLVQGRSKSDFKDKKFLQEKGYKKRIQVDENDWIKLPNQHTALITHEHFREVQEKMKKKAEKIYRGRGNKSLFARLAFCPDCGAGLNYKSDRKGYVCATYQKNGSKKCASHFIKHDVLKTKVLYDIKELAANSLNMKSILEIALKRAENRTLGAKNELKQVRQELRKLEKEQTQLARHLAGQVIDEETFKNCLEIIKSEQKALKKRESELEQLISTEKDTEENLNTFKKEITKFAQLEIADEEVLRNILHRLIDKIEVFTDGRITIYYNFKNPVLKGA